MDACVLEIGSLNIKVRRERIKTKKRKKQLITMAPKESISIEGS